MYMYLVQVPVAVKTLNEEYHESGRANFVAEGELMVKLSHHCIVHLIGICIDTSLMLVRPPTFPNM